VKTARSVPDDHAGTFLVERYLPAAPNPGLRDCINRVANACLDSGSGDQQVRYLQSTYLPSEHTCFCVFQAATADAVRAVNEAAGFTVDRITTAVVLHPS
jgi:hypothetical protein